MLNETTSPHLYLQLADTIRARILSGELAMGKKLSSIRAIAQKENHSVITVVKALDKLVAEGYVRTVPRKGMYVADRTVAKVGPVSVAMVVHCQAPTPQGVYFPAHLSGLNVVHRRLMGGGHRVSVHWCAWLRDYGRRQYYAPVEEIARTADAFIAGGVYDFEYLATFLPTHRPTVAYDVDATDLRIDSVFIDDLGSGFELTRQLIEMGHKHIAFIGGPLPPRPMLINYDPCARKRAEGYRLAMRTSGGLTEHVFHSKVDRGPGSANETFEEAIKAAPECTAMVVDCAPDTELMKNRKLTCVTWKGKTELAEGWPDPFVAVAECDLDRMGEMTWELLCKRLQDPEAPVQAHPIHPEIKTSSDDT